MKFELEKTIEIFAFNTGLRQAQWQISKAMMALKIDVSLSPFEVRELLKFMYDEIEKEMK